MTSGRLDPEMIKDMAKIMNEAIKGKVQVNLVINNRAGGNAPLIGGGRGMGSRDRGEGRRVGSAKISTLWLRHPSISKKRLQNAGSIFNIFPDY